jgi:hypothetical protein
MIHVLAVLGLVAACLLWYAVQRWAESAGVAAHAETDPDCDGCALSETGCRFPSAPERSRPASPTTSATR